MGHQVGYMEVTHNLAKELASRLNTTPRRDIFAVHNFNPGAHNLLDESCVRDDTTIEVDF